MLKIVSGINYQISPRSPRSYLDSGRSLAPGRSFIASQTTVNNGDIQKGIAFGNIIRVPTGSAAVRAAAHLDDQLQARTYLLHDSPSFVVDYRRYQTGANYAFQVANAAGFAITIDPILDEATAITGTVAIACTLQTVKNGVDFGAPFVVGVPGVYNHVIAAAQTGETYGVYAVVVGPPLVRLTDTVSFHIALEAAPVISGTLTQAAAATVTGLSSAPAATPVTLYKAGTTVIGTGATIIGGGWTITPVLLTGADSVTAKTGVGPSESPASAAKIVKFNAPVVNAVAFGATSITGTTTAAIVGSTLKVYGGLGGVTLLGNATIAVGASPRNWSLAVGATPGGSVITATVENVGVAGSISLVSNTVNVVFQAPVVGSPILDADLAITGTSTGANGTTITVYSNAVSIGTATVATGVWSLTTDPILAEAITAKAGLGAFQSAVSNSVTVT